MLLQSSDVLNLLAESLSLGDEHQAETLLLTFFQQISGVALIVISDHYMTCMNNVGNLPFTELCNLKLFQQYSGA